MWRSDRTMHYESERTLESSVAPGVKYTITRMSLGRRIELTRRAWELTGKAECLQASEDPREKLEAAALAAEIDQLYLKWGLKRVEGLTLDGEPATPESLIAIGPEELSKEILTAIRRECGLTDEERKN